MSFIWDMLALKNAQSSLLGIMLHAQTLPYTQTRPAPGYQPQDHAPRLMPIS